jgi:hypothetical protein
MRRMINNDYVSCSKCPVKDYLDMAEGCSHIDILKESFKSVCRKCKRERLVKGLPLGDGSNNPISDISTNVDSKDDGVYDGGDEEILQKRGKILFRKDEVKPKELGDRVE